jgi:hypothetical protein
MPKASPSDSPDSSHMRRKHASPFATLNVCIKCDIQSVQPKIQRNGHMGAMKCLRRYPYLWNRPLLSDKARKGSSKETGGIHGECATSPCFLRLNNLGRWFNPLREVVEGGTGIYPGD